jgi:RNA polymerase sigma factor (sigma-70 family)
MTDWAAFSDAELWARAVESRDGAAFGQLFERHGDSVYNHCYRRTGSWSTAEDLTSAVFLQAWRRRNDVRFPGNSALPWLLAVANNELRNADRSLRRQRRLTAKVSQSSPEPDIADGVVERADQERAVQVLLKALQGLKAAERDVLSMCDWAGLSYAEAADALGVPVNTVRSRLARSRQHLRTRAGELTPPACKAFETVPETQP